MTQILSMTKAEREYVEHYNRALTEAKRTALWEHFDTRRWPEYFTPPKMPEGETLLSRLGIK